MGDKDDQMLTDVDNSYKLMIKHKHLPIVV